MCIGSAVALVLSDIFLAAFDQRLKDELSSLDVVRTYRMAGSSRAVKAADAGCGFSCTSLPKDYRLILPPLPSGEGLRRTLVLHCDIAGRPYGINDFRKPLKDLGIIQQVSGIGAYQMSHVWLLNIKTDEAKKTLLDAGLLSVKDRPCLVVDPVRQEVRLKLHWVAFDVNAETIRRALREYGEVREVISDKWRDEDFEGVESTTRFVRLLLREASDATVDSESKEEKTKEAAKETTETGTPAQQFSTQADTSERLQVKEITTDASVDMVTTETTPAKRRLLEGDAASQQRLSQEKEGQWRVAAAKKPRGAGRLRSSSLSRGDDGSTP
ncbi:hypothetical protein HPB52_000148 [Rhipicephalus sanguineus]|uniref:Uncharacterized protein n=1 Tax=Rhipicephalus sanguineus TaxID=34632 RepID=A0A9D4PDM1_RHISA|nr:hypothetical protein HPB52_000148 [Rhipicephalus sanguineus]